MVNYDDFVKSWTTDPFGGGGAGAAAAAGGWGLADPLQEIRRRFNVGSNVSDQQLLSYVQQNGLPDPQVDKAQFGGAIGDAVHGFAQLADETKPVWLSAAGGAIAGGLGAGAAAEGGAAGASAGEGASYAADGSTAYDAGAAGGGATYGGGGGGFGGGTGMDETGAFDTSGSQGVFDSAGNGLYSSPSPSLADMLQQYGPDVMKFIGNNKGLLGALAGGLLGSKAQPSPAGTTTTTQDIPDWLKAYVLPNLNAAGGAQASLLNSPGVSGAAISEYLKTISGAYLDPASNPYLAGTYKTASDAVNANINSTFEGAGRYGSGAQAGAIGTADANLANQIFGGNYQAERARQVAAVGGAPTFDTQRSAAAFAPFADYKSLFPGSTATTTPYFTNPLGGILSGGLAGGMLGRMF